jgi:sortase (surface protein transpeptidase)
VLFGATLAFAVAWLPGHPLQAAEAPAGRTAGSGSAAVVAARAAVTEAPAAAPATVPSGLSIPAIGVDQPRLVSLGRNPDGTLQVPADYLTAGWFTGGPVPGEPGPSVIAGHVDSKSGPGVFFRLRDLRVNDVVIVRMSGGGQVRFVVDAVREYPKSAFPTASVYGPVPDAELRLITCGGGFDRSVSSYLDNIVVYCRRA